MGRWSALATCRHPVARTHAAPRGTGGTADGGQADGRETVPLSSGLMRSLCVATGEAGSTSGTTAVVDVHLFSAQQVAIVGMLGLLQETLKMKVWLKVLLIYAQWCLSDFVGLCRTGKSYACRSYSVGDQRTAMVSKRRRRAEIGPIQQQSRTRF